MQRGTGLHLTDGGTSVVIDTESADQPVIVHWGPALGATSDEELGELARAAAPQRVSGGIDVPARLTVVPIAALGWAGTPGVEGARADGTAFSPRLVTREVREVGAAGVEIELADDVERLAVVVELQVTPAGLLRERLTVRNEGGGDYLLRSLTAVLPLPDSAREILDTTGRHLRERSPQRHAFTCGTHLRESRRGRPGADGTLLLAAGVPGFGFEHGRVHAVHLAFSGNTRMLAERTMTGEALLGAGAGLLPGEIAIPAGGRHTSPWTVGAWGDGLNDLSARFHRELRARPQHPARPRPVTLNTWEAVYFDHDAERLFALAERAARVGVERFVLDDGWFRHRRDDTAGLGDWYVDEGVWPSGLGPLIEHVTSLGMEFGLWFEPEMVNPDSDLARAHPDWILGARGHEPVPARQQQVLDLSHPPVWEYLLERIDALLTEYDIAYLKWDHNRDLPEPGDARTGRAVAMANVEAVYRLLAELKRRHPGLEIEDCASGGARIDLGILEHTDRVWASDCIDPMERLTIQRYTGIVLPPELIGAHISGPVSHSTARAHDLDFRAGVALFGHLGIEWDITTLDDDGLDRLAAWVALYRAERDLLHHGVVVHADAPDPAHDLRGVVAADGSRALFLLSQTGTTLSYPPGRITLPGLDPDRRYRVSIAEPQAGAPVGPGQSPLPWAERPVHLSGRSLAFTGLQAPVLYPESSVLLRIESAESEREEAR